jgi:hypothetical protein
MSCFVQFGGVKLSYFFQHKIPRIYEVKRKNLLQEQILKQQQIKPQKQMNHYLRMTTSPRANSASAEVMLFLSIKDFSFIPYS